MSSNTDLMHLFLFMTSVVQEVGIVPMEVVEGKGRIKNGQPTLWFAWEASPLGLPTRVGGTNIPELNLGGEPIDFSQNSIATIFNQQELLTASVGSCLVCRPGTFGELLAAGEDNGIWRLLGALAGFHDAPLLGALVFYTQKAKSLPIDYDWVHHVESLQQFCEEWVLAKIWRLLNANRQVTMQVEKLSVTLDISQVRQEQLQAVAPLISRALNAKVEPMFTWTGVWATTLWVTDLSL